MKRVKCSLCDRPDRALVDSSFVAGVSFGELAKRFHVSKTTVFRHKQHVRVPVVPESTDPFDALDVASVLRYVAREAARLGKLAEANEDYGTALKATLSLRDGLQWLKTVPVELPGELTREEALERAKALVERLESTG
jgi:hypothetical protein